MSQTRTKTTPPDAPALTPVAVLIGTLTLAAAAAAAPGAPVATGASPERLAASPDAVPRYVRVLAGEWKAGGVDEVSASDDEYLVLAPEAMSSGGEESGGADLLVTEVAVGFDLAEGARPRKIRFELETVGCFTVDIGLRRWNSPTIGDGAVDVLSSTSHCLFEEGDAVSVATEVPRQLAANGSWIGPGGRIEVDVLVVTEVGATAGDEGSDRNVDEVTVETDY